MAFFGIRGGSGGTQILNGIGEPSSTLGKNGQLYMACIGFDLSNINSIKEPAMNISKAINDVKFTYIGGTAIGAQASIQLDLTNVNKIDITVYGHGASYNSYSTPKFSPVFIIENTINPERDFVSTTTIQSANGETYRIANVGDKITFNADVSQLTGNYYLVFSSSGCTSDFYDLVIDDKAYIIGDAYAKVNDTWQNLIGTNISDIS